MTKDITQDSWQDIYTVYYEMACTPTLIVKEGMLPAAHLMLYLNREDIFDGEDKQ